MKKSKTMNVVVVGGFNQPIAELKKNEMHIGGSKAKFINSAIKKDAEKVAKKMEKQKGDKK